MASGRRKLWLWIGGIAAVLVVALGFGVWYFVFRDDAPDAVNIDTATKSLDTRPEGGDGSLDGTWKVDPSIGDFSDFSSSFAGYRVQEELAGIGAKTAVGRTPDVDGSLELNGSTVESTDITVDMTTLKSDEANRDGAIRDQAIETAKFPTATFELTEPIDLGSAPKEGQEVSADAKGRLTLHGVTRDVTIPLKAKLEGDTIAVTGSLDIRFADYQIEKPQSFRVLSIADNGQMELQLFFTK